MALFHVFSEVENRNTGVPMSGVQVRVRFAGVDTLAPIYMDEAGTPFSPPNYCVTDADGMYSFYVDSGEYDLDFLVGSQVIKTIPNYRPAEVGPTGPANSTYTTTNALENADVANVSGILSEIGKAGTFTIRNYVDFTAEVAADSGKVNYIRSISDPTKVWVRTSILSVGAAQTGAASGLTVDAELAAKATLTGVARTATNLGTFTGSTIPDNVAIKSALQAVETAVENTTGNAATKANATAIGVAATDSNMGAFTGSIIPDNQTAKQGMQALENSLEAGGNFIQSGANTVTRTGQGKSRDQVSVFDFTTPAAADADGRPLNVPVNVTTTVANGAALSAIYHGPAQLQTADGNKRGKWFSQAKKRPLSLGNHDSVDTAFNGDVSRSHFQIEHRISGDALGTPSTGYLYTPEVLPHYTVLYVAPSAGHNQSTDSNDGRTGGAAYRVDLKHYGNGDIACYNGSIFVAGNKAGATHFHAQPAGVLFGGDMQAGANYVYFNPAERIYHDNGFDIACIHDVGNFHRENDTGGQSCVWGYSRPQSKGSKAIDFVYSFTGKAKVGLDFSGGGVDFGANRGAVSLSAGQRIYGNNYSTNGYYTDGFNGDWISYVSGVGWIIAAANNACLQVAASQVSITVKAQMAGKVGMTGLGNYANDAAAAAAGVAVGELYHNAGSIRVRLT